MSRCCRRKGKAFKDLETTGEVVSSDEVDQVGSQLVVAVIVISIWAYDRRVAAGEYGGIHRNIHDCDVDRRAGKLSARSRMVFTG